MHRLHRAFKPLAIALWLAGGLPAAAAEVAKRPPTAPEAAASQPRIVFADLTGSVTAVDRGTNLAGGNVGDLNTQFGSSSFEPRVPGSRRFVERFRWDFTGTDLDVFTGRFLATLGLSDTQGTFDGAGTKVPVVFDKHVFNLDRIDGSLIEPGGVRRANGLCVRLRYGGAQPLLLRLEIKDPAGGVRYSRLPITAMPGVQAPCWAFRSPPFGVGSAGDVDLKKTKIVALVIERQHASDGVRNPDVGSIDLIDVAWRVNRADTLPESDDALLDLVARRSYQYFLDFSSRHAASAGLPADRSVFLDLLSTGGAGFAFASHAVAAHRGWVPRGTAAAEVLAALRVLDDPSAFGPERVGRIGFRGFLYHFLGVDGRRKLNFDFPDTTVDESQNTVELSTIDTALAVMGLLVAQSYFDGPGAVEREIRTRAQAIYDRVQWNFMLEPARNQLYLGSKPTEVRTVEPYFEIPDPAGSGHSFSGRVGSAQTLDYYTDEALIALLLGIGSTTSPLLSGSWCALIRDDRGGGLIRTWPGSAFTYFFLSSFMDPRQLDAAAACPGEPRVDWFANSRTAFLRMIQSVERNPRGFATYGGDAWGISAAANAAGAYGAYAVPALAVDPAPFEDGTVTYYAMAAALPFGDDLRARAVSALRRAFERGHWNSRFGLPDAWNDNIAQGSLMAKGALPALRTTGPWAGRSTFAIDVGPMLLAIENARSGLVWQMTASNPNVRRGLDRLAAPQAITLEAEAGTGGQTMLRSAASGERTRLLKAGQTLTLPLTLGGSGGRYAVAVRYSNDNHGATETVTLKLDGSAVHVFSAADTGDLGAGWNVFVVENLPDAMLVGGTTQHQMTIEVAGGDGYGVEIDSISLRRID